MIVLIVVLVEEGKLIANHLSSRSAWRRIKVVTKLVFKAHCWSFSCVEVDEDEALGSDVRMDLKERVLLWVEVGKTAVLACFVKTSIRLVRPADVRALVSRSLVAVAVYHP